MSCSRVRPARPDKIRLAMDSRLPPPKVHSKTRPRPRQPGAKRLEPISAIYFTAGRDLVADGRNHAGRHRGIFPVARLRLAAGGLSHHSGADVLSWRQPRRDRHYRHGSTRKAVRPGARLEPDDLDQFGWGLGRG